MVEVQKASKLTALLLFCTIFAHQTNKQTTEIESETNKTQQQSSSSQATEEKKSICVQNRD